MQHPSQLAHRRSQGDPESGIVLLMVVFLTFLMLLALAIAAPKWAHQLKRQRDIATIDCGEQYERAIQLYYRKFHRYPNTIKQLEHSNNIRFLRRPCIDPLTGKNDWKLVLYGHAHVHPLGLWGKPLSLLGSVQASGGMYAISGSSSSGTSPAPTVAGSASGGDNMGFGSTMSSGIGSPIGGSATSSPLGASPGSTATGTGLNSPTGKKSGSSIFGSSSTSSGGFQTNAPFVGVVPPIKGKSIVNYRAQGKYSRWEFNYDPIVDMQRAKVSILGGSQSDLNGATSLNGKKSSNNSLFGGNNGFGNSGNSTDKNKNKKKSGDKNSGSSGSDSNSSGSGSSDSGSSQ